MTLEKLLIPSALLVLAFALFVASPAEADAGSPQPLSYDPFIGEIMWVPYNFAPRGWAMCNGQVLPIDQNQALFSLIGTTFGGDGRTTFALPDLRGRMPLHAGTGPGLSARRLGEKGGAEQVTLTDAQMPHHTHSILFAPVEGDPNKPNHAVLETSKAFTSADHTGAVKALGAEGSDQPHENLPPYLGLHAVIALRGNFPARD